MDVGHKRSLTCVLNELRKRVIDSSIYILKGWKCWLIMGKYQEDDGQNFMFCSANPLTSL